MLSQRLITRFVESWERQTGERLSPDDARDAAERMATWFEFLAKYGPANRGEN